MDVVLVHWRIQPDALDVLQRDFPPFTEDTPGMIGESLYERVDHRLEAEGRLRVPGAVEPATDIAFALSAPTVYEELVRVRGWHPDHATETITGIVVQAIVDPERPPATDPPPDWSALGLGGAQAPVR